METKPGLRSVPYMIAEVGSNHNGDMKLAVKMIQEAKRCGADAVKFQSWSPGTLVSNGEFARNPEWIDFSDKKRHFGSLREMCERYWLRPEQHKMLARICREERVDFLSSVFSEEEVHLCDDIGVWAHKVASMDVNYIDLLKSVGQSKKPVLLSTGMSTMDEIARARAVLMDAGCPQVYLMHCVSVYPTPSDIRNIRMVDALRYNFYPNPVGLSDHSDSFISAVMAVTLGAVIIEKHFTLDHDLPGWDHHISADPVEFEQLVDACHEAYQSCGPRHKILSDDEKQKAMSFRRSLVVTRDMVKSEVLSDADLTALRPGTGIPPDMKQHVVGYSINTNLASGDMLKWHHMDHYRKGEETC